MGINTSPCLSSLIESRDFFSLKDGASDGFPYGRKDVFTEVGVENCIPVWPHQIHKSHIEIIKEKPDTPLMLEDTDGIITDLEGVLLTTVHADCLPVYLFDDKACLCRMARYGSRDST